MRPCSRARNWRSRAWNNLHRSVLTHAVGERLQSIIKTAAVRLLAFGNGRSTAAPAGHADIKMWAGVKRNNHPVRHCRRILGCSAIRRARESPHLADRTGHRSCQSTPPGIPDQASDGRSPGSRIFRLPPPPGITPVAITASFPPTVAGAAGIRAKTRHRIPFSPPHLRGEPSIRASLKARARDCQRRRPSGGSGLRRRNSSL